MNYTNYEKNLETVKKVSYQLLSKSLPTKTIDNVRDYLDTLDAKLASHQRKADKVIKYLNVAEKGASYTGISNLAGNHSEFAGIDTAETLARLTQYSNSRDVINKAKKAHKLLGITRQKIAEARKNFIYLNAIQKQKQRQQDFIDLQHPTNAVDYEGFDQEYSEGTYEVVDLELEEEKAQAKRNRRLSGGWEAVKAEKLYTGITSDAWTQKGLNKDLKDAANDVNDYKSQAKEIEAISMEEWTDFTDIAKEVAPNHKSGSILLKYAKVAQKPFQYLDGKVNTFNSEIDTIKSLIEEIQQQLEYKAYQWLLEKVAKLEPEKVKKDLQGALKKANKVEEKINNTHSYVKVVGNFANKIVYNLERKSEWKALNQNPYGWKNEVLVFENELEDKAKNEKVEAKFEEKPKTGWLSGWLRK